MNANVKVEELISDATDSQNESHSRGRRRL